MSDPRIQLKNPWIAGVLAYLIPGAGHLYQGRLFKAALYSVCILGTFFYGLHLGDWRIVYYRWGPDKKHLGYLSQAMVGLPALPALVQAKRFVPVLPKDPWVRTLDAPLAAHFQGTVTQGGQSSPISGTLTLSPGAQEYGDGTIDGQLTGTLNGEMNVTLKLKRVELYPEILAEPTRRVKSHSVEDPSGAQLDEIRGAIPRPFWNWFEVPLDDATEEQLHGDLGKRFDLATLFTWIAGLLNILAIWDALEGPAYGYGDESPKDDNAEDDTPEKSKPASSKPAGRMAATT